MAIIKLSAAERRRVSSFFTCLVLAVFAWLLTVMSKPHGYIIRQVVSFINSPQKRAFRSLQSDTINVTINGSGWEMLFSKMSVENKPVTVDLAPLESKNFIVLSSQLNRINAKREANQQITGFIPDTLYFDFSNRREKRIPVHLVSDINYLHQFSQSGNVTIKPGYVIINGPASVIDNIKEWKTDTLQIDSVNEAVSTTVNLQPVSEGNISIYPKYVHVTVPVDEFTEKTLEVPVKVINNRNYGEIRIFPQKVKVTFTTALSRYAEIDEDFFEVTVDLEQWQKLGYKVLPVKVTKTPPFCKVVRLEPQNIDFIIKK
jgi:YbbR domain-containing protein